MEEKSRKLIGIYPPTVPLCSLELWDEKDPDLTAVHLISVYKVEDERGFRKECRVFVMDGSCRELTEVPGFHLYSCDNCPKSACTRKPHTPHVQWVPSKPWIYDKESPIGRPSKRS